MCARNGTCIRQKIEELFILGAVLNRPHLAVGQHAVAKPNLVSQTGEAPHYFVVDIRVDVQPLYRHADLPGIGECSGKKGWHDLVEIPARKSTRLNSSH